MIIDYFSLINSFKNMESLWQILTFLLLSFMGSNMMKEYQVLCRRNWYPIILSSMKSVKDYHNNYLISNEHALSELHMALLSISMIHTHLQAFFSIDQMEQEKPFCIMQFAVTTALKGILFSVWHLQGMLISYGLVAGQHILDSGFHLLSITWHCPVSVETHHWPL